MHGYPEIQRAFSVPRTTLVEFYNNYMKQFSNGIGLGPAKRAFLEKLDAATSRQALPLYRLEDAPYLTEVQKIEIRNENLEFYKNVRNLLAKVTDPEAPPTPEELAQYRDALATWAKRTKIVNKLKNGLLISPTAGATPAPGAGGAPAFDQRAPLSDPDALFRQDSRGMPVSAGAGMGRRNYIEMKAYRLKNAEVVWKNEAYFREKGTAAPSTQALLGEFAYAVPNAAHDLSDYDLNDFKNFYVSRYGGGGIGSNFGDGRVGTAGLYQNKGIGITPAVGLGQIRTHGNGGAEGEEALREAEWGEAGATNFSRRREPRGRDHQNRHGRHLARRASEARLSDYPRRQFTRGPLSGRFRRQRACHALK